MTTHAVTSMKPVAIRSSIHSSLRALDPVLKPASLSAQQQPSQSTDTAVRATPAHTPGATSALAVKPVQANAIQTGPLAVTTPSFEIATDTVIPTPPAPQPASAPGTSYPWANAPFPNSLPDTWGLYQRQCVSYTAWKIASTGRNMPRWAGRGDAKLWDDNATAEGIPVDTTPRVGDIAVDHSGAYGHTMYVEAVNPDGTIYVSQYNIRWTGEYSEETRSTAGLVFIHFP